MPLLPAPHRCPPAVAALLASLVVSACSPDAAGPANGPVSSVVITGTPSGAVAAGTTVQLSASARDAKGHTLTDHTATWRSANPSIATVDTSGRVATLDGGTAIITATVGDKTASATIGITPFPVGTVAVSPRSAKLYVNRTVAMSAEVRNTQGRVLAGKSIAWRSSDATKATVDATGMVTAHAEGSVTIFAKADGVEGTAIVGVIPDALTDWSGAADWPTFQGNASHTGFVPVTIDPAVFTERWIADFDGVGLNPVAAADGKIFVTNYIRLAVVDEATGARNWSYYFGREGGAGSPAYGDGGVFVATSETPYLWGFNALGGQIRFRAPYAGQSQRYMAPVVLNRTVFFGRGYGGGVYAVSSSNGAEQWFNALADNSGFTPAVRDGLVYAYVADRDAARLTVADAATGAIVYTVTDSAYTYRSYSPTNTAPALGALGDALVTEGGRMIAFDLANRRVKWERPGSFTGEVTIADGTLYAFNGSALEAHQESDGALLWSWTLPSGEPLGTIVATSNLLFLSSWSTTWALDRATHAPVWSYPAGGHLAVTRGGSLLIAQRTGALVAIGLR